jgi:hypothetical protein
MYPPAAMQDGWNFFSITAILLVFVYLLSSRTTQNSRQLEAANKEAGTHSFSNLWCKLFFIAWISAVIYITYGANSYLFKLLWKLMPGFSSLRVWPRFNIILVPILAWLLSLAFASFESFISGQNTPSTKKRSWILSPITVIITIYTAVFAFQLYMYLNNVYHDQWLMYFKHHSPQCIKFIIYGAVAFVAILSLIILSKKVRFRTDLSLTVILIVLTSLAILEMKPVGSVIWTSEKTVKNKRIHMDIAKQNKMSFQFPRTVYFNTITLKPGFSISILENWYFRRYIKFIDEWGTEEEVNARMILLGVEDGRKVFFSESINHPDVQSFLRDADRYTPAGTLISYTGDELRWQYDAPVAGYLSFIDNWDRNWRVSVDDKPADIEILFDTFKSVKLPQGPHHVRFYYQPKLLLTLSKIGL